MADLLAEETSELQWFSANAARHSDPHECKLHLQAFKNLITKRDAFALKASRTDNLASALVFLTGKGASLASICAHRVIQRAPSFVKQLRDVPHATSYFLRRAVNSEGEASYASTIVLLAMTTHNTNVAQPDLHDLRLRIKTIGDDHNAVAFLARSIKLGITNRCIEEVFDTLDEVRKVRVYLTLTEEETSALTSGNSFSWIQLGYRADVSDRLNFQRLDYMIAHYSETAFPPVLRRAYLLYKKHVGQKLAAAFENDVHRPYCLLLREVAAYCGFEGPPSEVLSRLAPHMQREKERVRHHYKFNALAVDKPGAYRQQLVLTRLQKAYSMLRYPGNRLLKQVAKAGGDAPKPSNPETAPPPSFAAPPTINEYVRRYIRPRTDCVKCVAARGSDATVRSLFASEGGSGRTRNVSMKRACPLQDHAISAANDGVPILAQYEREFGVNIPMKKRRFVTFMQEEFNVERLGQPPNFQVSLYKAPQVTTSITLSDGNVKLRLVPVGYQPVSRSKDNYMGFESVFRGIARDGSLASGSNAVGQ